MRFLKSGSRVIKMTEYGYKRMLKAKVSGAAVSFESYGEELYEIQEVDDLTPEKAQVELDLLSSSKPRRKNGVGQL